MCKAEGGVADGCIAILDSQFVKHQHKRESINGFSGTLSKAIYKNSEADADCGNMDFKICDIYCFTIDINIIRLATLETIVTNRKILFL
jgi:hypothetical protein